jgi:hypothetical protein
LLQLARQILDLALHEIGSVFEQLHLLLGLGKLRVQLTIIVVEQFGSTFQLAHLSGVCVRVRRRENIGTARRR